MNNGLRRQSELIHALTDRMRFPHPVEAVEIIETHISYVLLAGAFAYKFKKAVDLGFVDFSTLARRRFYCEEELRLNGRLAPDLYLAVASVVGSFDDPRVDGVGTAIEYAVKMRRFEQEDLATHLLERDELKVERIDEMADRIAAFHQSIAVAGPSDEFGHPHLVVQPMRDNFDHLEPLSATAKNASRLQVIRDWTERNYRSLHDDLVQRKASGMVRECHGDMHLANMAIMNGRLEIFDGIEFNPALRWIDLMSEIAFLTMDLEDRGAPRWSHRLGNRYLEHTGDYHGLVVLRFYQVYRAMVRAKVAGIRLGQEDTNAQEKIELTRSCEGYIDQAERYTQPGRPALIITHGYSGAGKTTLTSELLEVLGAVRIRSDVERKRMAGMQPTQRGTSATASGLYARDMSDRTYNRLAELVGRIVAAGHLAVVDAAFLKRPCRVQFARLAERLGVPFLILDVRAEPALLRERLRARITQGTDASDAGLEVLEHQLVQHDPLVPEEPVMTVDSVQRLDPLRVRRRLFR